MFRSINKKPTNKTIENKMKAELSDLKNAFKEYPVGGNDPGGNRLVSFVSTLSQKKLDSIYKSRYMKLIVIGGNINKDSPNYEIKIKRRRNKRFELK